MKHKSNMDEKQKCCYWDSENFDTVPVYLPLEHSRKERLLVSTFCFCSYECAFAFLSDTRMFSDYQRDNIRQLLSEEFMKTKAGPISSSVSAPQRFELEKYGGNMTINDFRNGATYSNVLDHRIINISMSIERDMSTSSTGASMSFEPLYDPSFEPMGNDLIDID